ncbi:head GIN domain-containing protein [Arenibacter amylolyticus]|uniref:head GIN domain-containing protein n=1 Tax=Arenibacter amylolyticus TaxID=1406873 RepID=UPI000A37699F|nr:head GIN domain-containing protein [Arenibacter amylolyticus]
MTTLARITITLILALIFSSCNFNIGSGKKGNGIVQEEQRIIKGDFTAVSASEGLDVYVTQGTEQKVIVEADENVLDLIATDLKNGTLKIHTLENIGRATKKIHVSLPTVTYLASSSGADLIATGPIRAATLELKASSGANLQIEDLSGDTVDADSSSGANIEIVGQANTLHSNASSGSKIKAVNLTTALCRANASSGANISVNVTESLVAKASSGANIKYTGNAKVEDKKTSSGSVNQL